MNQTILVTGGAGYIGSHAAKALAAAGWRPVTYDNLSTGRREAVRWGPLEEGDIADTARLADVIARHAPLAVIHFAASAYVGESVADPGKYYRNNVAGSASLLEAMERSGCRQIVFSSTCATYGVPDTLPIREDMPQSPINPYGRTKLMVEQMLADHAATRGLGAVALRYFNAAGADPDGETGECHDPETHLVPLTLAAARPGGVPLTIMGSDYPTPDGTCIRDYIHVADLADAHVRALRLTGAPGFQAFNLGTGNGLSVRDIVSAAERVTGQPVARVERARRPGDPPALVAAPGRARDVLGWEPRHSDIDTILQTAWRWMTRP